MIWSEGTTIIEHMPEYRRSPDDGILGAWLLGTAERHARWHPLTAEESDAAITELRALAAGRVDLLAKEAGLLLGSYEPDDLYAPIKRQAAELLIAAGADESQLQRWIEGGRRRRRRPR